MRRSATTISTTPLLCTSLTPSPRVLPRYQRRRAVCAYGLRPEGPRSIVSSCKHVNRRLASLPSVCHIQADQRRHASVAAATIDIDGGESVPSSHDEVGPIHEYDARVVQGRLRNDQHQRGTATPVHAVPSRPFAICFNATDCVMEQASSNIFNIYTMSFCTIPLPLSSSQAWNPSRKKRTHSLDGSGASRERIP